MEMGGCTVQKWESVLYGSGSLYCTEVGVCTVQKWEAVLHGCGRLYCTEVGGCTAGNNVYIVDMQHQLLFIHEERCDC